MSSVKIWLSAFRLRTLPLAIASIVLGSFLAAAEGAFSLRVALLCFVTAVLLQVLSNLANDFGDTIHGADSPHRAGPTRATQSGSISASAMRNAVFVFVSLSLVAGYWLIHGESWIFYAAGMAAVVAAVAYTTGPKPYGYVGLGDVFVFVFFGIVGVAGSYYLHTHHLNFEILLPAASSGFFSVAVLNVNNIRDMTSDRQAGKITVPVRLGAMRARVYHWTLLVLGVTSAITYVIINYRNPWQFLFLVTLPLILWNGMAVSSQKQAAQLDPFLKQMAVTTLLFSFSFGAGILF